MPKEEVKSMLIENLKLAVSGLLANKVRSFLTMLGIIIGIASVISIMTISDALNKSAMSSVGSMGANNIEAAIVLKSGDGILRRDMKNKDYISKKTLQI